MKLWIAVAALLLSCAYATAQEPVRKPCEDLKSEIGKKLDAKGVTSYTLDIVDREKESGGKVVGSCDGGTKSIVYQRATEPTKSESAEVKKSQ